MMECRLTSNWPQIQLRLLHVSFDGNANSRVETSITLRVRKYMDGLIVFVLIVFRVSFFHFAVRKRIDFPSH